MSRVLDSEPVVVPLSRAGLAPARQAYRLLYIAFIAAPIIAGLDKFTNFLVQWEQYLTPPVAHALPVSAQALMRAAGIVEIVAGLLVAFRPRPRRLRRGPVAMRHHREFASGRWLLRHRASGFRPPLGGSCPGAIERAVRAISEQSAA
jgi:hypothetical protein